MNYFPHLFSKGKLGRIVTKNRIVMSPMGDNMANADGSVSEQSIAYYSERAKGGAGIIIPGVVSVDYPGGKTIACQHRLDQVKYVKGWERMARSIHSYGALLIPQIHHAGMSTDISTTEGVPPVQVSPTELNVAIGASVDAMYSGNKSLTIEEIKILEDKFINCARFAQLATCDGVELHGAHGYLISQFLTPITNRRTDEYGGSIENRMRFTLNIIRGIRKVCGPDFIIGIRMPVHNWDSDGLTDEESVIMAKAFEEAGCDFLDPSGGFSPTITNLLETQRYEQGDRVVLSEKIKDAVNIPVFALGMLREPDFCENVLKNGSADYVVLGRTLLADPYWPVKAKAGKSNEIRRCISCLDSCYGNLVCNQSIRCVINPEVGSEFELNNVVKSESSKNVVVVGAGLAGMQASITANQMGHNVTLLEKSTKLGGQMLVACVPPHKSYINWATQWLTDEIRRQNINVKSNCDADTNFIKSLNPDVVIIATGALPFTPPINGVNKAIQIHDVLEGKIERPENKNLTVIGGGTVGCESALYLAEKGNKVTILDLLGDIATGLEGANKLDLISDLKEAGVELILNAKVIEIKDGSLVYEKDGVNTIETDVTFLSAGMKSVGKELAESLEDMGLEVVIVGDANKPSKFVNATMQGFYAAMHI